MTTHARNAYEQTGVYNCDIPALTVVDSNVETRSSTFFIEDGSYVKLKTLTLGYTFPDKWIKKARLSNLRVYLQAQNVFTLMIITALTEAWAIHILSLALIHSVYHLVFNFYP